MNYLLGMIVGASELTGECLKIDLGPPGGFGMIETIRTGLRTRKKSINLH